MNINVLKQDGSDTSKSVTLSADIFSVEVNEQVMYEAVRQYLAHQRQGTAKVKGRSEIARTSKKAFRQKGTGGARRGSYRSPIVRGGGIVFGPSPRTYTNGLNKKARVLARNSALTLKAGENAISVVDALNFETPSTKAFIAFVSALGAEDAKTLVVTSESDKNLYLSSRNLKSVQVKPVSELNTYGIMHADKVIFTENALAQLQNSVEEVA